MDQQSSGTVTGSAQWSIGRRLRTGAVGVIAVGGALVMGGAVGVVRASAHYVSTTIAGAGTNSDGSDFVAGSTHVVGTQIMDSAVLSHYTFDPARSVVFSLYGPKDATCSGIPLKKFTDTPTGAKGAPFAGPVYAGPYTATTVGIYHWTAKVMLHDVKESGPTKCGDEPETITQAQPRIDTTPTPGGIVGIAIGDSATVSGGVNATGTVTFNLYSPGDLSCTAAPLFTSIGTLSGGQASTGASYTTLAVGTYSWTAKYSGDANNRAATSGCEAENVTTTAAETAISTTPSAGGILGVAISDTATVSGGVNPTGSVTFNLYGPGDVSCTAAALYTDVTPLSNGQAASGMYTTLAVGTYSWTAKYSGDANNSAATSGCTLETATTTSATPAITTVHSAGGTIGVSLSDTATVSGGSSPTGTVTFNLFAPSNATCSTSGTAAVYTSGPVSLNAGKASSGSFTTTAATGAGTYQWMATYSGDANNRGVVSPCTAETVVVTTPNGVQAITPGGVLAITTGAIPTPTTGATGGFGSAILLLLAGLGVLAGSAALPRRRSTW